jgi:hypothetical protein
MQDDKGNIIVFRVLETGQVLIQTKGNPLLDIDQVDDLIQQIKDTKVVAKDTLSKYNDALKASLKQQIDDLQAQIDALNTP